jgi:MoaA/NifB/PqqE/SkfB family radical SAM enzyme
MKIVIMKKGVVDCTSDSRTHPMQTLREGIENAIKIFDKEVLELDRAEFHVSNCCTLAEHQVDNKMEVIDKTACHKLLNYFRQNPDQLSNECESTDLIHIHVKIWKFFGTGNNCSDYIDVYADRLEVSCQDEYDVDLREEFHDNIEELLGEDCATVDSDSDKLISLHISVTEKCHVGCNTCYVNRGLQRELEKEDWKELPLAEQYAIGGGEPSEYPFIAELVDYLKNERKGYVAITTNGQKIIEFGRYNPDKIAVSIDGLTQKEHQLTHNTNLEKAEQVAEFYKTWVENVCINHILHRENIDNAERFAKIWNDKGYEVNFILFTGDDSLKPTYDQLDKFKNYFNDLKYGKVMIDSCMAGLLNILGEGRKRTSCVQGLFSKYYRFGTITPCSHSAIPYPRCSVIEEYMVYFFKTLRPIVFIYGRDGKSGAHEWAFKAGYQGKIRHKVDKPLIKDTIYILTSDEERMIKESHYMAYFKDKMPYWLYYEKYREKMPFVVK